MIKLKVNSCDGIYDSLDVRFTKACDNNCSFCIERKGLNSLGDTQVDKLIESTIKSQKKDILILGGEPLLNPKLVLEYIQGIRQVVDTIYITTSLPKIITFGEGLETFKKIIEIVDGINVSIHDYTNEGNNKVLNSTNPHNRIDFLMEILKNETFQRKARICCNLVKGTIDSQNKIDTFLCCMAGIGVKHVKLNELQNVDINTYVSFEDVYGVKMKSPFAHGCQTDISDLFTKEFDMKVTLKRSCFCNKDKSIAKATVSDLVKCVCKRVNPNLNCTNFKVLYEDGSIQNGWLQEGEK
jgi:pyruvate-formate lyase-activating enzyme